MVVGQNPAYRLITLDAVTLSGAFRRGLLSFPTTLMQMKEKPGMSHRLCLAFSVLLLAACLRTAPTPDSGEGPRPEGRSETGIMPERITAVSGIRLSPDGDTRHYLSTSGTVLHMLQGTDSVQARIRMTLGFSIAYSRLAPLRTGITGAVTQLSLAAEELPQSPDQALSLPLEFQGYLESGGLHLDSLDGSPIGTVVDCQAPALNGVAVIRRSLLVSPLILSTGLTWTDSSTVPACSGSIPVALTAVRKYTVAGQTTRAEHPVIVIDRLDRIRARGEGAQGQHRISLLSEGSGSARIYLDRPTGFLRHFEATQTTELTVGSSGRSQRFRQVVEEQVSLQP